MLGGANVPGIGCACAVTDTDASRLHTPNTQTATRLRIVLFLPLRVWHSCPVNDSDTLPGTTRQDVAGISVVPIRELGRNLRVVAGRWGWHLIAEARTSGNGQSKPFRRWPADGKKLFL